MRTLDRSFFRKDVMLAAARVRDKKLLGPTIKRLETSKDVLQLERHLTVVNDPDSTAGAGSGKCVLLRPEIRAQGMRR